MSFTTFSDFADEYMSSWVGGAFRESEQGIVRIATRKVRNKVKKGINLLRFISAGAAMALGAHGTAAAASGPLQIDLSSKTAFLEIDTRASNLFAAPVSKSAAIAEYASSISTSEANADFLVQNLKFDDLLADQTKTALLGNGLARLREFSQLPHGWDGGSGEPMKLASLGQLNNFFYSTGFLRQNLGLFMSQEGNLIINWLDDMEAVVEIEFLAEEASIFLERTGRSHLVRAGAGSAQSILAITAS